MLAGPEVRARLLPSLHDPRQAPHLFAKPRARLARGHVFVEGLDPRLVPRGPEGPNVLAHGREPFAAPLVDVDPTKGSR